MNLWQLLQQLAEQSQSPGPDQDSGYDAGFFQNFNPWTNFLAMRRMQLEQGQPVMTFGRQGGRPVFPMEGDIPEDPRLPWDYWRGNIPQFGNPSMQRGLPPINSFPAMRPGITQEHLWGDLFGDSQNMYDSTPVERWSGDGTLNWGGYNEGMWSSPTDFKWGYM